MEIQSSGTTEIRETRIWRAGRPSSAEAVLAGCGGCGLSFRGWSCHNLIPGLQRQVNSVSRCHPRTEGVGEEAGGGKFKLVLLIASSWDQRTRLPAPSLEYTQPLAPSLPISSSSMSVSPPSSPPLFTSFVCSVFVSIHLTFLFIFPPMDLPPSLPSCPRPWYLPLYYLCLSVLYLPIHSSPSVMILLLYISPVV